jgi:sugar lactone lactonase YvrE
LQKSGKRITVNDSKWQADSCACTAHFGLSEGCGSKPSGGKVFNIRISTILVFSILSLWCSCPTFAQTVSLFAASAPLNNPQGITIDGGGNIYVVNDEGAGGQGPTIVKIAPNGMVTTLFAAAGPPLMNTGPQSVAVDSSGNVYFVDPNSSQILRVAPNGNLSTFVDAGVGLPSPNGLAFDKNGNLYVSCATGLILKVTPAAVISTFVPASTTSSPGSLGMAFDQSGNLYVANTFANSISKITPAGAASTFAVGNLGSTISPNFLAFDRNGNLFFSNTGGASGGLIVEVSPNGTAVTTFDRTNFSSPKGLAFNADGNLLVVDENLNTLTSLSSDDTATVLLDSAFGSPQFSAFDSVGNLYVTNRSGQSVTKVTPDGVTSTFVDRAKGLLSPEGIAFDASGTLYVIDLNAMVDKIAADGTVTVFVGAAQGITRPTGLAFGPDGNLYVSDIRDNTISKVTPSGVVSTFVDATQGLGFPNALAFDHSGNLYVANLNNTISKVTSTGVVSTFVGTTAGTFGAMGLAFDVSGNLYVSYGNAVIVQVTPDGVASTIVRNTPDATTPQLIGPAGLAFDSEGRLTVADSQSNSILRISFTPSPLAAAVLPDSRSVQVGKTATLFATVLNTSQSGQGECGVELPASPPNGLTMNFQTTNSTNNALIGTANQPVAIAAGGLQTFLLSFKSDVPLTANALAPVFFCQNVTSAPTTIGVNTVDLVFSSNPIADIIALAAITSNDGTVHLSNGVGAFAVATFDAGAAADLTVTADTGAATLPVQLSLCQTTSTGQCMSAPAASVPVNFAVGGTPTFSIFASTTAQIPFAPGSSRVFVRFLDASGTSHGTTSVAVTTD